MAARSSPSGVSRGRSVKRVCGCATIIHFRCFPLVMLRTLTIQSYTPSGVVMR